MMISTRGSRRELNKELYCKENSILIQGLIEEGKYLAV